MINSAPRVFRRPVALGQERTFTPIHEVACRYENRNGDVVDVQDRGIGRKSRQHLITGLVACLRHEQIRGRAMSIENRLRSFISSEKASALVLQGTWGRGKTHLWRALMKEQFSSADAKKQYAYVSLFGINSLDELKVAIYQNGIDLHQLSDQEKQDVRGTPSRWNPSGWFHKNSKALAKGAAENTSIPIVMSLSKLYNAFAFYRVRDMLVCLDDIERRGNALQLKDVMGLVSLLWEQRSCHVVLISNTKSLSDDDAKIWAENKEKVFHGEVTFAPSAEKCIDLIFDRTSIDVYAIEARSALMDLDVTNIRIIERVKGAIELTVAALDDELISEQTKRQITRSLAWIVYCHSGRGEGAPPLDLAGHTSIFRRWLSSNDTRTEQEKKWDLIRERYGAWSTTPLDEGLSKMVINGYPDAEVLREQVLTFDQSAEANSARQRFDKVWDNYHYSFSDKRAEIVDGFRKHFPDAAGVLSAETLDSTVWLLRELGEDALADDFIRTWIVLRQGKRVRELDPNTVYRFRSISDAALTAAIDAAYAAGNYFLPLPEAIALLGQQKGSTQDAAQAIANTPLQDLVQFLDTHPNKETSDAMRLCLEFPPHPEFPHYAQAAQKARDALTTIAARSKFDAVRTKHIYKVQINAATAPAKPTHSAPPED
jgi:hypothetical protein